MKITKLAIIACSGLAFSAFAQDYDLVIVNGRVMDPETMFDAVANVGIKGDRITSRISSWPWGEPPLTRERPDTFCANCLRSFNE